jgi:GT2 family glycosyltransferase
MKFTDMPVVPDNASRPSAFVARRSDDLRFFVMFDHARHDPTDFSIVADGNRVTSFDSEQVPVSFGNQLTNSNFDASKPICWGEGDGEGYFKPADVELTGDYRLPDAGVAYVFLGLERRNATLIHSVQDGGEAYLPVASGRAYAFSGYFATHRCRGRLILCFQDAANNVLTRHEAEIRPDIIGGNTIDQYRRVGTVATAPEGASSAALRIIVGRVKSDVDAFFFMTRLWFGRSLDQTLPPWSLSQGDILEHQTSDPPPDGRGFVSLAVNVPLECLDGREHMIQIFDRGSGAEIAGSPLFVQHRLTLFGSISGIVGDLVTGRILSSGSPALKIGVELQIDGETVADGLASGDGASRPFSLPIPPGFCDGRPHVFGVAVKDTGQVIARHAAFAPTSITPFDALQAYAGLPLDPSLSPAGPSRYRSLLDNLEIGRGGNASPDLKSLHDILLTGPRRRSRYLPLVFPTPEQPDVSIIVPAHNNFALTYVCLASLLFAANLASCEVIVVDDGSSDETARIEQLVQGIKIVRHGSAMGFVDACNDGADAAVGRYLVFLNNDTEVTSRWLDEMIFLFDNIDDVGLVGAKLLNPDGSLQDAGGIVWNNGNPWNYGRGGNPFAPRNSYVRQVDYLTGAALMVPRKVWDQVGKFSLAFVPGYFEDTDLAFKVRDLGLKTVFAARSQVYHFEGATGGSDVTAGAKRHQEVNRPRFKRKWMNALRNYGAEGVEPERAKDRNVAMRALMVDFEVPRLDHDAGSYAAIQEIRCLQALGFKVTFLPINFAYLGRHTEQLQRMGVEILYAPFVNSFDQLMSERGDEFDLVFVTRYLVARQVMDSVRAHAPHAKLVVNLADLHFLREIRSAVARADSAALEQARMTREDELDVLAAVDLALTYSAVEEAVIHSHNFDRTKVARLPWIADVQDDTAPFEARRNISFIGGFRHAPNGEAVNFFLQQVWPKLSRAVPDLVFDIYGSSISPAQHKSWSRERVVVHGQIDDIRQMFDTTRVVVVPLQSGAGVKGKVFDCLSAGVPSVLSPLAAEGIGVRDGTEAIIASSADSWVAAITRLYTDAEMWSAMSGQAKAFIARYHGFDRGVETIRSALDEIGLICRRDPSFLFTNRCRPVFTRRQK